MPYKDKAEKSENGKAYYADNKERIDAERYRWLTSARTAEQCADENAGALPPMPQDLVIADMACWYNCKDQIDAAIDAARAKGAK